MSLCLKWWWWSWKPLKRDKAAGKSSLFLVHPVGGMDYYRLFSSNVSSFPFSFHSTPHQRPLPSTLSFYSLITTWVKLLGKSGLICSTQSLTIAKGVRLFMLIEDGICISKPRFAVSLRRGVSRVNSAELVVKWSSLVLLCQNQNNWTVFIIKKHPSRLNISPWLSLLMQEFNYYPAGIQLI